MIGRIQGSCVLLMALLSPGALRAQDGEATGSWSAVFFYDAQRIGQPQEEAFWHTVTAGVQRKWEAGSVSVQGVSTRRFALADEALVLDGYHELWSGAYGNLLLRAAPGAEVLPRFDAGTELFQTLGRAELSASYRHQEFAAVQVGTMGVGLGYYLDRWYLRPRSVVAHIGDSWSPSVAVTARRYLGDSTDNTVDVAVGFGEEVLEAATAGAAGRSMEVITSASRFASVRTQRFVGARIGGLIGASYSDYAEIPDRWGISIGLITRW